MWISSTVDSSHVITLATMHLVIMICILLFAAVSNSLAETPLGSNVESPKEAELKKEVQQSHGDDEAGGGVGSKTDTECWLTEDFTTEGSCEPCSILQMKQSQLCCEETGFRQKILCTPSGVSTFKSCPKSRSAIERSFWTFEGVMLLLGMCSGFVALMRRRKLDWQLLERVRKQIANSV